MFCLDEFRRLLEFSRQTTRRLRREEKLNLYVEDAFFRFPAEYFHVGFSSGKIHLTRQEVVDKKYVAKSLVTPVRYVPKLDRSVRWPTAEMQKASLFVQGQRSVIMTKNGTFGFVIVPMGQYHVFRPADTGCELWHAQKCLPAGVLAGMLDDSLRNYFAKTVVQPFGEYAFLPQTVYLLLASRTTAFNLWADNALLSGSFVIQTFREANVPSDVPLAPFPPLDGEECLLRSLISNLITDVPEDLHDEQVLSPVDSTDDCPTPSVVFQELITSDLDDPSSAFDQHSSFYQPITVKQERHDEMQSVFESLPCPTGFSSRTKPYSTPPRRNKMLFSPATPTSSFWDVSLSTPRPLSMLSPTIGDLE